MVNKARGFTIVELVVVIVVIGILATITVVAYNGIQQRARDVALQSDLVNAGKKIEILLASRGHSVASLRAQFVPRYSAWVVGEGAENALSSTQVFWNDIAGLPPMSVSPGSTLEIITSYSGHPEYSPTEVNARMVQDNVFCLAIASPGSSYDYRPGSGIHSQYDHMLYFDSAYGKVMTMAELAELYTSGKKVTCEAHVVYWLNATGP